MIERAVAAIRAGKPVVLPTDTVYGLCADPSREAPAREVARLKGREERQPTALLVHDIVAPHPAFEREQSENHQRARP